MHARAAAERMAADLDKAYARKCDKVPDGAVKR